MEKNTKILLGLAAVAVVGYVVYNNNKKKTKYVDFAKPKKKSKFLEFWDKVFSARGGSWVKKNKTK